MRYIGLDLGTKTLGIALSDATKTIASPVKIIRFEEGKSYDTIPELKEIINEFNVEKIILGFPKNMNNTVGESGERTLAFKQILEDEFNIPVIMQDERLTTVMAEKVLIEADVSRKGRKKVIDKQAAGLILQGYLDRGGF